MKIRCILLFVFSGYLLHAQTPNWVDFNKNGKMDLYENPTALIDKRVNDLLSQMTIPEKILLLREVAPAIPRLGIAKYDHGNESLHGVVRPGKFTVFPQAIGLAATWNPDLIYNVSTAISDEARARWNELDQGKNQVNKFSDLLAFWSPTVNMARDPRWGRTPETYGEDCYLTSQIGVSYVKGLQGNDPNYIKVISTPKHFAGNNEEHNRFECKMNVSEQTLRAYYLPAFKALVTSGYAESIMTAYNAINGVPCTVNKWLLTDILRKEWGFNGYVVSDCGAPGFVFSDHHYTQTREEAAAMAIKAGLDLECGGYCNECFIYTDYLPRALEAGLVTDNEINIAAFRVLRARFKLGLFDAPELNPYSKISPKVIGSEKHQNLALETARQSIVLLKNEKQTLPLNRKKIKSIAVFGINAATCEFGDYSGTPLNSPVSPLQGIINKVGDKIKVTHVAWVDKQVSSETVPAECFSHLKNNKKEEGLSVSYFSSLDFRGTPTISTDKQILFNPAKQAPNPLIPQTPMSVRWSGSLSVPETGRYEMSIHTSGEARFYLNDQLLITRESNSAANTKIAVDFVKGKEYTLRYEYVNRTGDSFAELKWKSYATQNKDPYAKEKQLAKQSDVSIAFLGTNKSIEMEGRDRETLNLPQDQMDFIKEISAVNPTTIVVLIAGSSLTVNWLQQHVPAIVDAWYPGEQGGTAIADVLVGDYNPSGKLPITFYESMEDLPPFNDYEISKGRTYMYLSKKPLYPFGHGLSYTTFEYSNIQLQQNQLKPGENCLVSLDVKNIGKLGGAEVVQLYLQDEEASEVVPLKQLKRFERIELNAGEKKTIQFVLTKEDMSFWNYQNKFILEPGRFNILVGSSSADIRQRISFDVQP